MMDKISLIIVHKGDTEANRQMLKDCYESAIYTTKTDLEVIVVYDAAFTVPNLAATLIDKKVKQPKPFNYNASLNTGADVSTGNYLYFANSDLIFKEGALDELVKMSKKHNLHSSSAICPVAHKDTVNKIGVMLSYRVGTHFTGWGFMLTRYAYDKMKGLRTNCPFYCADNETVEQLKELDFRHGLVKSAEIEHLGQRTQKDLDSKTYFAYCVDSVKKFNKLYGKNIFNLNNK
jgi:GT2 family glycosyltransferase